MLTARKLGLRRLSRRPVRNDGYSVPLTTRSLGRSRMRVESNGKSDGGRSGENWLWQLNFRPYPTHQQPIHHLMNLPQELLDEIFGHVRRRDWPSFSLVSHSWLESSRRLRFAVLSIKTSEYNKFLDAIPPANTGLLRHVRSLTYFLSMRNEYRRSDANVCALQDYLPSLCRLQKLTLCNMIPSEKWGEPERTGTIVDRGRSRSIWFAKWHRSSFAVHLART